MPSEVSAVLDSVDAYLTPVEFDKQMLPMHIHVFATSVPSIFAAVEQMKLCLLHTCKSGYVYLV